MDELRRRSSLMRCKHDDGARFGNNYAMDGVGWMSEYSIIPPPCLVWIRLFIVLVRYDGDDEEMDVDG